MGTQEYFRELISELKTKKLSKNQLSNLKILLCKKHKLARISSDFEILMNAKETDLPLLMTSLLSKPGRTGSGVAVVALMTSPRDCPHGRCIYCPGGTNSFFGDVPQSYTGKEPATLRGIRNRYDPYLQVFNRLEQYTVLGHSLDKIELIIMGGTFISAPKKYRDSFITYSLKAMNDFSEKFYTPAGFKFNDFKTFFEIPGDVGDKKRTENIQKKLLAIKGKSSLLAEQENNKLAKIRCVAMCIETRPDYCLEPHINEMLRLGTTRIELGVQTISNRALKKVKRGHTVQDSIKATRLLKDSLLKVGYHMMPGLPGTTEKEDLKILKELFENPSFRPDALKIYPCMVMPGTGLYDLYKKGKYQPLPTEKAAKLIAKFKKYVPAYCRIMRVQRDIPSYVIEAGVNRTNLRQYIARIMKDKNIKCRCIRCREPRIEKANLKDITVNHMVYDASGGIEVFISADDSKTDTLYGFCRLRIANRPFRKEITTKSAGIRELHVYGEMARIGSRASVQHRGIGKKLLAEAERIAQEMFDKNKIVIISGIGVREYYEKLGYTREGAYMIKNLIKKLS